MKFYVASKGKGMNALEPENVIAALTTGVHPLEDARSYALDETRATDAPTYVYEVEVTLKGTYETRKEVVFVPASPYAAGGSGRKLPGF